MKALAAALLLVLGSGSAVRAEIEITTVTSKGGITAWLYETHEIPMLSMEASFKGGAALDPPGKEGVARLMVALLDEGAGQRDLRAFAEAEEAAAVQLGFDATRDSVDVSVTMLTEQRDASLDLLRSALTEPRFDAEAVERVKAQMLSALRSDQTDPDAMASRAFYAQAFAGQPYARPPDGLPDSVASLDEAALRAAHAATLVQDRLRVAVVGDITAAELGPILDETFGGLPKSGPPLPPVAEAEAPGTVSVIDLDIPQSVVMFGERGIPREDPDYIPAFVMDTSSGAAVSARG